MNKDLNCQAAAHRARHAMTDAEVLNTLTPVLRRVFYDDSLIATHDTTAEDVAGWDSLGHVRLLVEIEREFSVRFEATEIGALKDVGQLAALISRKLT